MDPYAISIDISFTPFNWCLYASASRLWGARLHVGPLYLAVAW